MVDLLGLTGRYGVVSTGASTVALVIDWADHSIYNHAFVLISSDGALIEATPEGVRRGHISEYRKHPVMLNSGEEMTVSQRTNVARIASGYVGRKYGWADIVRLALARFGVHLPILDRYVATESSVICSELVAEVGHAAGLDWSCGRRNLADVTPGLLADRAGMEPYIF